LLFGHRALSALPRFPRICSISRPSEARPRKSSPNRTQLLSHLTTRNDLDSSRPGWPTPRVRRQCPRPIPPSTARSADQTLAGNRERASCRTTRTAAGRRPGPWIGDPNIAESPVRYRQTTPRDHAVRRPSTRRLINAPSCISARMRSGRATPPIHGWPKERAEGLRKPPIL
jgi:hypothetical protein